MEYVAINDFLDYIGVNDRETSLFENLWPLPQGISYNSYLLKGEKTALLDTVKITKISEFLEKLELALGSKDLDYLVIHHMEPDHSGSLTTLLDIYPDLKIVGNSKTLAFLEEFYGISENTIEVDEGDELDLGGRKLKFFKTPMVHWPESMVSYEVESKILFSQDIFGSFATLDGGIFDSDFGDFNLLVSEVRRYYSNIVGKHSKPAQMALKKLEGLEISTICPIHGPIWKENPEKIIELYTRYAKQETEAGVVIAYGSMYGTNAKIANFFGNQLANFGVRNVKTFDVSKTSPSYILSEIWKYNSLVIGSCTYDNHALPTVSSLLNILEMNKIENHNLAIFGSFSWSGGGVKEIKEFAERTKFDLVGDVEIKSSIQEEDYEKLTELAKDLAEKVLA